MGYKAKKQKYKLVFADEDMDGLEVIVTKLPLGMVLHARELAAQGPEATGTPQAQRDFIEGVVQSRALISWNLEDEDGVPIPLTVEGILAQDEAFFLRIISSWTLALGGVSAPLDDGSTSGDAALEASIPMETLSPNQSS